MIGRYAFAEHNVNGIIIYRNGDKMDACKGMDVIEWVRTL